MKLPSRSAHARTTRTRRSVLRIVASVAALAVLLPAAAGAAAAAPEDDGVLKVLLFYKPNFHASHVQARQAVRDLATELAGEYDQTLEIQETEDLQHVVVDGRGCRGGQRGDGDGECGGQRDEAQDRRSRTNRSASQVHR